MRKIFCSSGHGNIVGKVDCGASANGYIEGVLAVKYRQQLAYELEELGICPILDDNKNVLSETLRYFKNMISENSICLDIHFNSAANPKATGTETLIPGEPTVFEIELAAELSKATSETLNIPLRGNHKGYKGVKTELESHHGKLGFMRLQGQQSLLEICFLSNKEDMISYETNWKEMAKKIAKVLHKYATK